LPCVVSPVIRCLRYAAEESRGATPARKIDIKRESLAIRSLAGNFFAAGEFEGRY
jgi:hypothetical protein